MADEGEERRPGALIIIGGHEDRDPASERGILREVTKRLNGGKLVLATVASYQPEGYFADYQKALADLHDGELVELYIHDRREAENVEKLRVLDDAAGIFFSGGDQLRITSQIGGTCIEAKIRAHHERGGLIAGTSAGASAMSDTMLVRGAGSITHRLGGLHMAPGLGLIRNVIIDQHFAERGRFGRLLGAIAHNPRVLGIGLDEDTAAIVEDGRLSVIGSGGVYVVDGEDVSYSNVAEGRPEGVLSIYDVRVHVLGKGNSFDLAKRRPVRGRG